MVGSGNNVAIVIRAGNLAEEPLISVALQSCRHENAGSVTQTASKHDRILVVVERPVSLG